MHHHLPAGKRLHHKWATSCLWTWIREDMSSDLCGFLPSSTKTCWDWVVTLKENPRWHLAGHRNKVYQCWHCLSSNLSTNSENEDAFVTFLSNTKQTFIKKKKPRTSLLENLADTYKLWKYYLYVTPKIVQIQWEIHVLSGIATTV